MLRGITEVENDRLAACRLEGLRGVLARLKLRIESHLASAIVTPDEPSASAVREITGGVGAPVVVAEPDATLSEPDHLERRRFLTRAPRGPRILLIATAVTGMGGIARYEWFWATAALDLGFRVRICALWKWGPARAGSVVFEDSPSWPKPYLPPWSDARTR